VLWFCFLWLRILEPETQKEDESLEDFTLRVQEKLATSLNIVTTQFTVADKKEYLKKLIEDKARRNRETAQRMQSKSWSMYIKVMENNK